MNEPPWEKMSEPTAAQWVDWFLGNARDAQEQIAARAIGSFADINRCLSSGCCWIDR